jgi:hypothetical protein
MNIFEMDVPQFRKVLQTEYDASPLFRAQMLCGSQNQQDDEKLMALRKEESKRRAEAGSALEVATRAFAESLAREKQGAVAMPNVRIGPFEFDWVVASKRHSNAAAPHTLHTLHTLHTPHTASAESAVVKRGSQEWVEAVMFGEKKERHEEEKGDKEEEWVWVVHDIVECKVRADDIGRSFLRFQHSLRWLKGWVQHAHIGYFSGGQDDGFTPASFARFVPSIECKRQFGRDFIVDGLHFVTPKCATGDGTATSPLGNSADCAKTLHAALNLRAMPKCASHAGLERLLKFARKLQRNTAMDGEPCMQYLLTRNIVSPVLI